MSTSSASTQSTPCVNRLKDFSADRAQIALDKRECDASAPRPEYADSQVSGLTEEWRQVPRYEGWVDASSLGRVRLWYSVQQRRRLPSIVTMLSEPRLAKFANGKGRHVVSVRNATGRAVMPVQRAVALAFLGEPAPELVSCHFPDRNPYNCRLETLRWDSERENKADEAAHRTCCPRIIQARLDLLRQRHPHLRASVEGMTFAPFWRDLDPYDAMLDEMQSSRTEAAQ